MAGWPPSPRPTSSTPPSPRSSTPTRPTTAGSPLWSPVPGGIRTDSLSSSPSPCCHPRRPRPGPRCRRDPQSPTELAAAEATIRAWDDNPDRTRLSPRPSPRAARRRGRDRRTPQDRRPHPASQALHRTRTCDRLPTRSCDRTNPRPVAAMWWRGKDLNLRPSGYEPTVSRAVLDALVGVCAAQSHFRDRLRLLP